MRAERLTGWVDGIDLESLPFSEAALSAVEAIALPVDPSSVPKPADKTKGKIDVHGKSVIYYFKANLSFSPSHVHIWKFFMV